VSAAPDKALPFPHRLLRKGAGCENCWARGGQEGSGCALRLCLSNSCSASGSHQSPVKMALLLWETQHQWC